MKQKLTSVTVIYHYRYRLSENITVMEVDHSNSGLQASSRGSFSKVDLPVVLSQLLLSPRPRPHGSTDAGMCWGARRSWSWALLCREYFQGGRVGSRCCRNLAPPTWIPRRTRTERRFLNSLKQACLHRQQEEEISWKFTCGYLSVWNETLVCPGCEK